VTRREYGLLEFLLRHKGLVVSKTEILAGVWDAHYDGDDNIVEVYVGYLRRKLGATMIETIRGSGYRLRAED
jgi:two-component system OmpR family response regulator